MPDLIQLEQVTKTFGAGDHRRVVLDALQAGFPAGQVTAIRGRSGSGKTTLLNLLAGLDVPDSGQIMIDSQDLAAMTPRQRTLFRRASIGIIFKFFNLIPTLTVLENVSLPAELRGGRRSGPEMGQVAHSLLAEVGLADRQQMFPDQLSGGEQQRVAIARALVTAPPVLLADEPTGNLDQATGEEVLELLLGLVRSKGSTMIVVTHSHHLAAQADRVMVIERGKLHLEASGSSAG
jgi:putative ABC transport system ATP-binding protein